jgi:integrase
MARTAHPWYLRQTGWWMAYLDGKKTKLVKGPKNAHFRGQAEKKLRELLHLRDKNPAPGSPGLTVAAVIDLYLTHAKKKYAERSLEVRQFYLQLFAEEHGWREVNDKDCLPFHLTEWLDAHPEWASDWTRAHAIAVIQRPFNWAVKQRLIPANPFRGVTHPTGKPRRPLTDGEFQALLRATSVWRKRRRTSVRYASGRKVCPSDRKRRQRPSAGARFRQLLVFLRFTGMRPGEASRLEWRHIDLDGAMIVIPEHKTSRTQKVKKPRIVPLHPVVLKLLIFIRRLGQPGERVFLTHRKTPWNRSNLGLRVRRLRETAGVPDDAKLYGLRHAFGTRSILNGVDIKTLAELMGHTTTRMTEHYLHLAGERAHLAAAMLRANARSPAS